LLAYTLDIKTIAEGVGTQNAETTGLVNWIWLRLCARISLFSTNACRRIWEIGQPTKGRALHREIWL